MAGSSPMLGQFHYDFVTVAQRRYTSVQTVFMFRGATCINL